MSNRRNNRSKIAIEVLVNFLFKSIERSQHTLNKNYNTNHSKRNLFANYLLNKENVSASDVLSSINKPDRIVKIINNMQESLTANGKQLPKVITDTIITSAQNKLTELLAEANESTFTTTPISQELTVTSIRNNNNISKYDIRKYELLIKNGILDAIFGLDTKDNNIGPATEKRRILSGAMHNYIVTDEQMAQLTDALESNDAKQIVYNKVNLHQDSTNKLAPKLIYKLIDKYLDELCNTYVRVMNLLIRKVYPTDQSRKNALKSADQQNFEKYIKTDDIPVNEVVLLFTKEQINSMLDVVNNNSLNLQHAVTKRLNDKLNMLLNARSANNTHVGTATSVLNNLTKRLTQEEKNIDENELNAKMILVFDDNDLHTYIKKYMPKNANLLLRNLLTDKAEQNNTTVNNFITIIETIKSNSDDISNEIIKLLITKHKVTTDKANAAIINDLIKYYKEMYCNVTLSTPLDESLRMQYNQAIIRETSFGGAKKTLTKRRKLSKRLQTKKRRV